MKTIRASRGRHYLAAISSLLITASLIAGMLGCDGGGYLTLTITSTEGGSVTFPGEGTFTYNEGAVVNLVAEAEEGYYFANWTGDVGTMDDANTAETTITVNGDYSIIANFVPDDVEPVWDWYDLDGIRDNLDGSYVLMNDLDSTTPGYGELATSTANGGEGWQPMGDHDGGFNGTLDGTGYEIKDLFIDGGDEVGLFGRVDEGGYIRNIGVVNANVTGGECAGILVGENFGRVSNAYCTGSMTGTYVVGGLLGFNNGPISASHFIGSVTGDGIVGGLMGANWLCSVTDSYATGNVIGDSIVGGLIGDNDGGTVSNTYFTGSVAGEEIVGGLMAVSGGGMVSNSYSTGSVTGTNGVGGLLGCNHGTISNAYSTGIVNGERYVGGLVGDNTDTVSNSYSTGSVTGTEAVGGLVGRNRLDGVASNSFWDVETSGQATSDGGTGKNTTEMKDIMTFSDTGWDIIGVALNQTNPSHIWNIVNNVTYPFLSWEP